MEYAPKIWKGQEVGKIFSEVLEVSRTAERGLVRIEDDIKGSRVVSTINANPEFVEYKEKIRETDFDSYTDTIEFADRELTPKKMMVLEFFTMDQLRNSRFNADMATGAANMESSEFNQAVLNLMIPKLGVAFEKRGWNAINVATKAAIDAGDASVEEKAWAAAQTAVPNTMANGLIADLINSGAVNAITGAVPTSSNLDTCYDEVLTALNTHAPALIAEKLATIFAPKNHELLIRQANKNETYRDVFTISGDKFEYLGVPIEFVPIDSKILLAGRGGSEGDLCWGTDTLADVAELKIDKVNNVSDEMFIKAVATLDTAALLPQQKVLRIAA